MIDPKADQEMIQPILAEGVDEEPVESTRRLFVGRQLWIIAAFAIIYSVFHLAALNGISISGMTGGVIDLPFLPEFPLETWNFRIVHVAGAPDLGISIVLWRAIRVLRCGTDSFAGPTVLSVTCDCVICAGSGHLFWSGNF